jgi:alpha-tubulin suppressor-like RCC1 family protein
MTINRATITQKIQNLVNTSYTSGSSDVEDVLATVLAADALGEVNIITVATVDDLPNLVYYSSPDAMLYYVQDLDVYAISSNSKWLTLDGRLLRQDTTVNILWAWGYNSSGLLGDNSTVSKSSPVSVVGGFTDWCQVSTSGAFVLAIRTNGTLWSWGSNTSGRLGDNTLTNRSSPVSVVGGFTDWCQASASNYHSLAVRQNGTLWAWGINTCGLLGDGTVISRRSPVSVVGGFTDWCQASAGREHSLAVRTNGSLWAWGRNYAGKLGDDTVVNKSSPVSVVGGFTDWCQASANRASLAIRSNGTLWGWGDNFNAQIGDGTIVDRSSPVSVVGGFTDWCQVVTEDFHTIGLRANGTLWAWGYNRYGRLGTNSTENASSPVSVVGGFTDWCQVTAGYGFNVAIRTNGTAWSWGSNFAGQLGDNTTVSKSSPVLVAGGFTDWCTVGSNLGITSRC